MFETRQRIYWEHADFAGIVFFPHFSSYVQRAEEELFRHAGTDMVALFKEHEVVMPRVEVFTQFKKPIHVGDLIAVQLGAKFQGEKSVRMEFRIVDAGTKELRAEGYLIAVCVSRQTGKSRPMPDAIREIYAQCEIKGNEE